MRRVDPTSVSNISPMMMPQVVDTPIVHTMPQMLPIVPMATPATVATDGLRQDMREDVDLMKNLTLNLVSQSSGGRAQGKGFYQARSEGQVGNNGGGCGYGKGRCYNPTCYN